MNTSTIFVIGQEYNNYCSNIINNYHNFNIIKIFKIKKNYEIKNVLYTNKYKEIRSFLRIFTLPLGAINTLTIGSEFMTDLTGEKYENYICRLNEFGTISLTWKLSENESDFNNRLDYLKEITSNHKTRCCAIRVIQNYEEFYVYRANKLASVAQQILAEDDILMYYSLSAWNKPYNEIEIIYEKQEDNNRKK